MKRLFLLKPDFLDLNRRDEKLYFCPDCAVIQGIFTYYPYLKDEINVEYVDFARPRKELVDLLGEENQSCPVLVLEDGSFINDVDEIISHLTKFHRVGHKH